MAFKMKRGAAPKFKELGSSPKKIKSPAKIDLSEGLKKMYGKGKKLYDKGKKAYDKLPKGVKNVIKDTADPNPYSKFYRMAREQSPTLRDLTDKAVKTMIKGKKSVEKKLGK